MEISLNEIVVREITLLSTIIENGHNQQHGVLRNEQIFVNVYMFIHPKFAMTTASKLNWIFVRDLLRREEIFRAIKHFTLIVIANKRGSFLSNIIASFVSRKALTIKKDDGSFPYQIYSQSNFDQFVSRKISQNFR